jgi:hypothetical protein
MPQTLNPLQPAAVPNSPELVYELASIVSVASPIASEDTDWYRYVIKLGVNEIVGHRRGDDISVRRAVELIVSQLNSRLVVKASRAAGSKR